MTTEQRPLPPPAAEGDVEPLVEPAPLPEPVPVRRRRPLALALLVEARPKQWLKNVLVFAAPGAAGVLTHRADLGPTLIAFAAFCLAASGTYYLNDARDVEADRGHPKKRNRPVAAGEIPLPAAQAVGAVLTAGAIGLALVASWQLLVVVTSYLVLTTCYTIWWKHMVLYDVVAVAAGFVLRAIAGAAASHVEISQWFFIVATFGSLLMVTGKRHAEAREGGEDAGLLRATLDEYSDQYLAYLRAVATGVVLVAYCVWAFQKAGAQHPPSRVPWFQLSIVPFAVAILRYALLIDQGHGGEPEEVVFSDRGLQILAVLWAVTFALGIYKAW